MSVVTGHSRKITADGKFRFFSDHWRTRAADLQRKGFTLSEIAAELDVPREDVVRVLYWETVQ